MSRIPPAPPSQRPEPGDAPSPEPGHGARPGPSAPAADAAHRAESDVNPQLRELATLSLLLERLDRLPRLDARASAAQYQRVVRGVADRLRVLPPSPMLERLLTGFQSAAEVYENLHYERAGLCRSPLEPALQAELTAAALLRAMARRR